MAVAMLAATATSASPSVNVGMHAAFPRGPYLLELLETAAGENSTAYFPLLDKIASGHFASANSDAELYHQFLQVLQEDSHIITPDALSTFKLSLSLRAAAPRSEAHYQYYSTAVNPASQIDAADDCQSWALIDNQKYCSPGLAAAVEGEVDSKYVWCLPHTHPPFLT
jgi:UDP-glucose:glycoprotein glucosyltransferase